MYKLNLPIQESGYSLAESSSGVQTATKGGFSRSFDDLDDADLQIGVTWKLSEGNYNYLMQFFTIATNEGALPFLIDLLIDSADLTTQTAYFSSAGPQLSSVQGLYYFVSDTLSVVPNPINIVFDTAITTVFNASNGDSDNYLNWFNIIVNQNWPSV